MERGAQPLTDPAVAMLLQIYLQYPKSAPKPVDPDIKEFFQWLGFKEDQPQDFAMFAALIGRSPPSVYRHIRPHDRNHHSLPGRPVLRWIEAVSRLNLTPRESLKLMAEIVAIVGQRQQAGDVLSEGWSRQDTAVNKVD
ncbi:hypothetical protein [Azohydromonas australica]|uniref:hypothetical protein n=1 Tax=Azohydromonas australica TaxID=364039 RepID=UPI001EE45AA9|nr:hypothetical protein [Azohydromonas australica]